MTPGRPARRFLVAALLVAVIAASAYSVGRRLWVGRELGAAEEALRRGDHAGARRHLQAYLRARPDQPDAHLLLARAARRAGDTPDALFHLRRAEELGGVVELIALHRTLLAVEAGEAADEGQLWALAENAHPDAADILEVLGKRCLGTFRLDQALGAAEQWLKLEPDNPHAWHLRGKAQYHLRGTRDAIESYRKAVTLAPDLPAVRLLLAGALLEQSEPREALEHAEAAATQRPDDAEAETMRARALLALDRSGEAVAVLDRLLAARPGDVEALVVRGKAELLRDDPAKAEPWLRKAVKAVPYHREAVHNLGLCLQQLGKKDESGKLQEQLGRIDDAQKRLGKLTQKILASPRDADLRAEAGEAFLTVGNDTEGLRWLQSALKEDPRHGRTHRILRDYYRKQDRPELAKMHERALSQK